MSGVRCWYPAALLLTLSGDSLEMKARMKQEDKQRNYELAEKLLSEQNFAAAVIAGAVGTFLAAVAYGIVVALWDFSYSFAAAGVGVVVGISMQYLGRGIETKFAVLASVYTIAGCLLGNVFMIAVTSGRAYEKSPFEIIWDKSLSELAEWAFLHVSPIDVFFWFVAIFAAAFLSRRPLSRSDRLALGMYELKN